MRCRCNPLPVTTRQWERVSDEEARAHIVNRYELTERYVRDMFITMGQPEDAENGPMVGRVVEKLMRAMDRWAVPGSTLRMTAKELQTLPGLRGHWRKHLGD